MNGIFTISLDFELHWGGFEKWPLADYRTYFDNTRVIIPKMLQRFHRHEVHVTWATVGILFHRHRSTLERTIPERKPMYIERKLSAYHYMETLGIGDNEKGDPYHYAGSLVDEIVNTPFQELASHTFSHYYCNEAGQTLDQFRDDLAAACGSARTLYNINLKSLVFPRNQFNEDYLRICRELGFTSVRDNPRDWFWNIRSTQNESAWKRLNRGLDAYLPVGKKNTYSLDSVRSEQGLPHCLPASRLLRPYNPKELLLNDMKIERIKNEMERAAQNHEVYHLWWHPHNFGNFPAESLAGLDRILTHYDYCRQRYGMISLTMSETSDLLTSLHARKEIA